MQYSKQSATRLLKQAQIKSNATRLLKQAHIKSSAARLLKQAITIGEVQPRKKRPISATIGRLADPLTASIFLDKGAFRSIDPDDPEVKEVLKKLKKEYKGLDTAVRLRGARPLDDLKRIVKNKNISIPSKILGAATTPTTYLAAELLRADHYNPLADSATVYRNMPEILDHELGHAKDFNSRKYRTAYMLARSLPGVALYQEGKASRIGAKRRIDEILKKNKLSDKDEESLAHYSELMGAGLGSYTAAQMAQLSFPLAQWLKIPMALGTSWAGRSFARSPKAWMSLAEEQKYNRLLKKKKSKKS